MPRGRGGRRQGTPGKAYSNRTDLMTDYAPDTTGAAARGGMAMPVAAPAQNAQYPEDTPMLLDPTQRPEEPLTAGLPIGAGPGPQDSYAAMSARETEQFKPFVPMLMAHANSGYASPSFVKFARYLRDN